MMLYKVSRKLDFFGENELKFPHFQKPQTSIFAETAPNLFFNFL